MFNLIFGEGVNSRRQYDSLKCYSKSKARISVLGVTLYISVLLLCGCGAIQTESKDLTFNVLEDRGEDSPPAFIVTSSKVDGNGGKTLIDEYKKIEPRIKPQICDRLDLYIPGEINPLVVCLRPFNLKKSVLHKDFVIKETVNGNETKITSLNELMQTSNLVEGFVLSFGQSHVTGKISENGDFFGTVMFSNDKGDRMKMCTVTPLSTLEEHVNYKSFEDKDDLEEFLKDRTIKPSLRPNDNANSIVTCSDKHDGRLSPFKGSPEQPKIRRRKRSQRKKRNIPEPINHPGTYPGTGSRSASTLSTYKYLEVFFEVDERILKKRFANDRSALTIALTGYVEMTDWITRASDFDGDNKADNIGFKLAAIEVAPKYVEMKGGSVIENLRNHKVQQFFKKKSASKGKKTSHSVTIYMVPIKSPLYMHLAMKETEEAFTYEGCSACTNGLTGLINPSPNRYSSQGEIVRMFFATVNILISSIVYTEKACVGECAFEDVHIPETGGDTWGACLLEGSLFDTANIPLNAFRLSKCSLAEGKRCLTTLEGRTASWGEACLKTEEELSYCGNGLIEPGEECDCGTLAMCQLQKCKCGPRNGVLPCMKLSETDVHICESLIRCRGYRFINEVGQGNGSHILASIPSLLKYRLPADGKTANLRSEMSLILIAFSFCASKLFI